MKMKKKFLRGWNNMRVSIITDKILIIPLFLFIFSTIKTLSFYFDRLLENAAHFREKLGTLHADSLVR